MNRANTASATVGAGTPMSSALAEVHLPVPFWPAVSSTTSTNGLPVDRVPLPQDVGGDLDEERVQHALVPLGEDAASSAAAMPSRLLHAARTPRRSSACRRTRCRCGPSSRSGRRRSGRCTWCRARRRRRAGRALRPRIGLPVCGSTLAAIAFHIGFDLSHAHGSPPGISEGPNLAPSSPPETPEPKNRRPRSFSSFSRRMVSVHRALPPSMMISPCWSRGARLLITASVGLPALTSMTILRGRASDSNEVLQSFASHDAARGIRVLGDELLHCGRCAVVDGDLEPVIGDIQREILAHDGEANETDIGEWFRHEFEALAYPSHCIAGKGEVEPGIGGKARCKKICRLCQ